MNTTCKCCKQPLVEGYEASYAGTMIYHTMKCVNDECESPTNVDLRVTRAKWEY